MLPVLSSGIVPPAPYKAKNMLEVKKKSQFRHNFRTSKPYPASTELHIDFKVYELREMHRTTLSVQVKLVKHSNTININIVKM